MLPPMSNGLSDGTQRFGQAFVTGSKRSGCAF
jgi:hypothetical protein